MSQVVPLEQQQQQQQQKESSDERPPDPTTNANQRYPSVPPRPVKKVLISVFWDVSLRVCGQ